MKPFLWIVFLLLISQPASGDENARFVSLIEAKRAEIDEITSTLRKRDELMASVGHLQAEKLGLEQQRTKGADARKELRDIEAKLADEAIPDGEKESLRQKKVDLETALATLKSEEVITGELQRIEEEIKFKETRIGMLLGTLAGQF